MRFDDSLGTVLSAEISSPSGAQSTWRQLVDLVGRGRAAASDQTIKRLRMIRADVPPPVRAASARALIFATPPAALVALFVEDEIAVAAPVLRAATLAPDEWTALLPGMSPSARSILRHRRDLGPQVERALESFGSVDFVLAAPDVVQSAPDAPVSEPAVDEPGLVAGDPVADPDQAHATEAEPAAAQPEVFLTEPVAEIAEPIAPVSTFVSIASVAAGLPMVAEALRQAERPSTGDAAVVSLPTAQPGPGAAAQIGPFPIADLVARIAAYQRTREATPMVAPEIQPELFEGEPGQARSFRFETDAAGVIRWIEGAARAPLIGLSLDLAALPGGARVDGVAAGAFRRRAGFANARLSVDGRSDAAGQWRITGTPVFDRATGRFTGYRGTARRPRADESAEPTREGRNLGADALRQLVHELRTPTNAIAGFAEMIESQMLGPVPAAYRAQAAVIRSQASGLLGAIDDIDMAARIETRALDLRPGDVPVAPMIERICDDLAPLVALRSAMLDRYVGNAALAIRGDERAVERLVARIMATLVAAAAPGERVGVAANDEDGAVVLVFDRPAALAAYGEDTLLTIDAEAEAERGAGGEGAPLLGTGFALRLARNLAAELHGSLTIGARSLTLRLPAAEAATMEQAFSH